MTVPFFIGPKDFDKLHAADTQLVRAIDFGMFAIIVVPLLQALKWINSYLGNYGWSIVVLTVIINILIFPLRHRSMVSMKKMQAIQPEVKAIQDRYAKYKVTDPERQKMNSEMLALYKQKGVSPASGCVPMLLTMPILLAFYNLLGQAIELRGAPFVGWIHDLSAKDPTYVWPVLMGVTMFFQQRMMPSTADPDAAEDLPADARHLHGDVPEHAERPRDLLARQQRADDRPAVPDQPHHTRGSGRNADAENRGGDPKRLGHHGDGSRRTGHRLHPSRHDGHGAQARGRSSKRRRTTSA